MIKITMAKQDLLTKLSKIECGLNKQIFMYSDKGFLIAETSNGELVSRVKIIEIEKDIQGFCVDACFLGIVKKLPNEPITFGFSDKTLSITCAKVETKINHIDGLRSTFKFNYDISTKLLIPSFKNLLKKLLISIHKDSKQNLSGVNIKLKNNVLTLCATDRFRLSRQIINIKDIDITDSEELVHDITIPGLTLLKVINASDSDKLQLQYTKMHCLLCDEDAEWYIRMFNEPYPNIEAVVPNDFVYEYELPKNDLLEALDRCFIFSKLDNEALNLDFIKALNISKNSQMGEYVEEITIKNKTNDSGISLCLSNKYLYDAVKSFDGNCVQICINGAYKPIVLKNEANNGLIQLILPIKKV